jgi:predicted amidohydrolase
MGRYRLCALQVETGKDPKENREKIFSLCEEVSRTEPDFIVFPEMFEIVVPSKKASVHARTIPSTLTDRVGRLAKRLGVNVIGGTLFEQKNGKVYNTAVVFDRSGALRGTYRKMHLFDAFLYGESEGITRGEEPLILELEGLSFGVAVCYDVRFPELFRHYALHGAQVVFLPSAFFQPNQDHWQLGIRSRALDNGIFVLGCNQTGKRFVGRSMVADPWGIVTGSLGTEEGILTVDIDTDLITRTREKLPLLENRRFDVVKRDQ